MSNFENKIIIIIKKKRQSKSSNTINLYIYLSVLKLLSKIDVYMYILYKQDTIVFLEVIIVCSILYLMLLVLSF